MCTGRHAQGCAYTVLQDAAPVAVGPRDEGPGYSVTRPHSQCSAKGVWGGEDTLEKVCHSFRVASAWPRPVVTLSVPVTEASGKEVSFQPTEGRGRSTLLRPEISRTSGLWTGCLWRDPHSPTELGWLCRPCSLCQALSPVPGCQLTPCLCKWPVIRLSRKWVSGSSRRMDLDPGAPRLCAGPVQAWPA